MTGYQSKKAAAQAKLDSMEREALKLALEALEVVTKELLAVRDELAERGARPKTNAFHQKLWDSSFKAYTDHALPAATAIKEALAQPAQQEQPAPVQQDWKKLPPEDPPLVKWAKAQPAQQEPVATFWQHGETGRTRITMPGDITDCDARWFKAADLYTSPPQRTWVGLNEQDFSAINQSCLTKLQAATSAESILKEKNNG